MKRITLIILLFSLAYGMQAQSASISKEKFMKLPAQVSTITITLDGYYKNIDEVLSQKFLKETGKKNKSTKGYTYYPNAVFNDIASHGLDYYYKVEKAGAKDHPMGRVILLISSGGTDVLDPQDYPDEFKNAKIMLEELPREVRIYELQLAIEEQEKALEKANKEYLNMGQDSVDLVTRLGEATELRISQRQLISNSDSVLMEFKGRLEDAQMEKKITD